MSCHGMSCHAMSCHGMSCHATPRSDMSCQAVPCQPVGRMDVERRFWTRPAAAIATGSTGPYEGVGRQHGQQDTGRFTGRGCCTTFGNFAGPHPHGSATSLSSSPTWMMSCTLWSAFTAATGSMIPNPNVLSQPSGPIGSAVARSRSNSSFGVRPGFFGTKGCLLRYAAMTPLATGAAAEVPVSAPPGMNPAKCDHATRSGFCRRSAVLPGPRDE